VTRRASKFLIHLLGTLVGVVTVLLAFMAWRLAQGPIEMGSLTPFVEAAINDQELGFTIQADQAELTWDDWQEAFEIRVLGFQAFDKTGIRLLSAHEVVLEMALPPLVRGELRPKSVTLVRPQLSATRQPDGSMGLALIDTFTDPEGADAVDEGGPPPQLLDETAFGSRDLLQGVLALAEQTPFDRLVDIEVVGADLWVDDRMLGLMWNAPAAAVTLRRVDDGVELNAQLVLKTEGHTLDADVVATYNATVDETVLSSHLAAFSLAGLSDLIPQLPDLEGLDVVVDVQVEARFDGQFGLVSGSFLVDAQSGTINLPDVFEEPFDIGPSHVSGYIRPGFSGLELTEVDLDLGIEKVHGRVVIGGLDLESEIEARVDLAGLAVNDLSRYWPVRLAVPARTWVLRSISDGTINQASIAFRAGIDQLTEGHPPLSNLVIDIDVSDATVHYLPTMPAILGVSGHVAIIDNTLHIDTGGGRVEGLSLSRGTVTMDSLDGQEGMLIGVELSGSIQDALVMASHEPFTLAYGVGIDPSLIDGTFAGSMEIVLPRLAGLTADQVIYRVAAEVQDVALTKELRDYRLDSDNVFLLLDSTQVLLEGDVRLNGVPFQARYRHDLTPEAEILRVVSLEGRVEDEGRAALGLVDPIDMSGPVDIVLDMAQTSDETMTWNVVADLAPVTALFPLIGIDKAAGEPGRATVRLVDDGGAVLFVEQVDLGVGTTVVEGSGLLRATDLSLAQLDLSRFAFGRNDFSGAVSVREDGFFDVTLAGGEVDLEPMMDQIAASSSPKLPPFQIRGRLDRIWITDNDAVGAVHVEGVHLADDWESLAITGVIADGSPMSVNIWRFSETERRFEYSADNAGDAIRTFGLFDNVDGGALQVSARIDDGDPKRPVNGVIRLDGFVLKEAPILAQIASLASLTAIGNALTGNGLEFDSALIPFRKVGDIVTVQDGRVFGTGLGLTIAGDVDLGANLLDLNGTIVPAYLINTAVSEIPIIGDLLTGEEEGGGIFAFTFDVDGPRESPEIKVDPLSVLAPGILRNMFTAPTDEEVEQLVQGVNKPEGGR